MKILIAISSKEYSGPTLSAGMNISHALNASTTIVDVGKKISEFSVKEVGLVNEMIESWILIVQVWMYWNGLTLILRKIILLIQNLLNLDSLKILWWKQVLTGQRYISKVH